MEAKGKNYLKVVGILMLIGGIINGILGIFSLLGGGVMMAAVGDPSVPAGSAEELSGLFAVAGIGMLVYAVAYIITGIVGIKNAAHPENAAKCQKWGIIAAVALTISLLCNVLMQNFTWTSLFSYLLPLLFILGARKNMESAS